APADDAGPAADAGPFFDVTLPPFCFACNPDALVLKLDADGNTLWTKRFGDADGDAAYAVTTDAIKNVIVARSVRGNVACGDGLRPRLGKSDAFVAELEKDGGYVWARRCGGAADDHAYGVGVDANQNVFVAGTFGESMSIGAKTLKSAKTSDVFVAKLD